MIVIVSTRTHRHARARVYHECEEYYEYYYEQEWVR